MLSLSTDFAILFLLKQSTKSTSLLKESIMNATMTTDTKEMVKNVSVLETSVLKAVFGFAQKKKNVSFPKEVLVGGEVLKPNQLNTVLMNLKAKNIIQVNVDLFGFSMVSMTFDGIKFCEGLMRKKAKKAA